MTTANASRADSVSADEARTFYENTPVMLHSIDSQGRLVSVSDRWLEVLGYERADVIGRRSVEFLTPESRRLAELVILPKFFSTGQCRNVPYQFVTKSGGVVDVLLSADAVRDESGELVRSIAVSIEVTEWNRARDQLRVVEAKYQSLLERVPAVVYTAAVGGGPILYVSPQIEALLGYTPAEWTSQDLWSASIHPDDRERILASTTDGSEVDVRRSMEYRLRARDGHWIWVRDERALVNDGGGSTVIQGFIKDVSDRQRAEQARRATEEQYRRIVDTAQEGLWVVDADARTTFVNARMAEMLKYDPAEMIGLSLFDFMDPLEVVGARRLFERRRKGIGEKHDFLFRCKDDTRIWTIVSASPMFDDKLVFVGALGMVTDITERKEAEMALAISEAMYRGIVEDQTELICRFTPRGELTFVNGAFCRYFGKTDSAEIEGKPFLRLFSRENRTRLNQHLASLGWHQQVATVELEVKARGGRTAFLEWTSRAIFDKEGRLTEFQSIGRDLTDRRHLERDLHSFRAINRKLLDSANDAIFLYGVTDDQLPGKFIEVNETACRRLQYHRDELLGLRFLDLLPRERLDGAFASWQRLLVEKRVRLPQIHVAKSGRRIAVEVEAQLLDLGGKPTVLSIARETKTWRAQERGSPSGAPPPDLAGWSMI